MLQINIFPSLAIYSKKSLPLFKYDSLLALIAEILLNFHARKNVLHFWCPENLLIFMTLKIPPPLGDWDFYFKLGMFFFKCKYSIKSLAGGLKNPS